MSDGNSTRNTLIALALVTLAAALLFLLGTHHEWNVPPLPTVDAG